MKTFSQFIEEAYLYEMRKEDKVKGKKKTPLTVSQTRTTRVSGFPVKPAEEGDGGKRRFDPPEKVTHTRDVLNPTVMGGRFKQGAYGGTSYNYRRHEHGGADPLWTPAGSKRGKKKVPGEKRPEIGHISPADKLAAKRAAAKYAAQGSYNRRRIR